jgi:hypothetical protein
LNQHAVPATPGEPVGSSVYGRNRVIAYDRRCRRAANKTEM